MPGKLAPVNATGSLAALRMRRGQDVTASQATPMPGNAKSVLQPRDANVQTPAAISKASAKKAQADPPSSTAGKLPPVNKGVLARAVHGNAMNQTLQPSAAKANTKTRVDVPAGDSEVAVGSAPMPTQKAPDKHQSRKRPAKAMKESDQDEASTFDVPQSSDDGDEDEYKPSKKARKGKAALLKRVVAARSAAGSLAASKKKAPKSKAKASKPSPEPEDQPAADHAGPSKSTRAKMKAESGTSGPVGGVKKGSNTVTDGSKEEKEVDEQAAVTGSDARSSFEDAPPVGNLDAPTPERSKKPVPKPKEIIEIKKEIATIGDKFKFERRGREGDTGASQENAIVLSDAQSSSDGALSSIRRQNVSNLQEPRDQRNSAQKRPRTPAAMRSPPPVAGDVSTKPTTAGLIDPQSARKSTIISFDKFGPRNQGTTSARVGRPSVPPADRSSLPPQQARAGSVAKLHAPQQDQSSSGAKTTRTVHREPSVAPRNVAADVQDALAGLKRGSVGQTQRGSTANVFKEDVTGTTHDELDQAYQDDAFTNIDQFDDDTTLTGDYHEPLPKLKVNAVRSPRTVSQLQMPPPVSKTDQKRPVNRAPVVPSMAESETQTVQRMPNASANTSILGKRQQPEGQTTSDQPSKRARRDQATDIRAAQQTDSLESLEDVRVLQRNPVQPQQQEVGVQHHALSQRGTRRQKSQGTVDIHGSPVPEGMIVAGLETVLETFSQRVNLSSDKMDIDNRSVKKDQNIANSDLLTVKAAQKQPARLSSNTKPVPAEPSLDSQAITHIARLPAGRGPFVAAAKTNGHPPTDPFASSEEERQQPGKTSSTSTFFEHLRQQAACGTAARKIVQKPAAGDDDDEDPEKTLVEEEEEDEQDPGPPKRRLKHRPKRIETFDSVSSADMSTDMEDTSCSLRDLGIWRQALKPHQMNLFDELVIIAHGLVRHLVDKEEATACVIDDYRRRGEELMENLQASQAKDLREYHDALREKKKRLQKEMNECGRTLVQVSENVKAGRKEVRKQVASATAAGISEEGGLRDVMGAFC